MRHYLECLNCHERAAPTVLKINCDRCGGLFRVGYEGAPEGNGPRLPFEGAPDVSLGEGDTPIVELRRTAKTLGLGKLWAKMEMMAPTGSFKDRGSAVLISMAKAEGVGEFAEDSSGNAGASLSAYAAAAGMKAHIFVPSGAAAGKLDQIRIFGAELHVIDGPRQAATDAASRFVESSGLPYLSHNLSAYFSEGMKAFANEVEKSAAGGVDYIVIPVGNGSLLTGAFAGYEELVEAGRVTRSPAFYAVQTDAVRPLAAAVAGERWDAASARPTVASGIAVSSPPRLAQSVEVVRGSGGGAVTVTDELSVEWQRRLAATEGIFCEVTSAAAFAGLEKLMAAGKIERGASVLAPVTGSGLKEPAAGRAAR